MIYSVVHARAQREGIKLLDIVRGFAVTNQENGKFSTRIRKLNQQRHPLLYLACIRRKLVVRKYNSSSYSIKYSFFLK